MRAAPLSRLKYVLLLGDTDTLEAEVIHDSPHSDFVSDHYYSAPSVQRTPGADAYVLPLLSIGRIPASDGAEGMKVVDQIIEYEKSPPGVSNYSRKMSFAAAFIDVRQSSRPHYDNKEDSGYLETVEYIRSRLEPAGYDIERIYTNNRPGEVIHYQTGKEVPQEVVDEMVGGQVATDKIIAAANEGRLIICHRGHGEWIGWGGPIFENQHLSQVTSKVPSVFYSINCFSGDFGHDPGKCFSENMLVMEGAAPSLIAGTGESSSLLNNHLIKALFDATFPGVLPTYPGSVPWCSDPVRRLGDVLKYAKFYLPAAALTDDVVIKEHFEMFHVIGDPTLELWSDVSGALTFKVRVYVDFLEILLSTCPMGCVLTVWSQGQLLKRLEPVGTRIVVPIEHLTGLVPELPWEFRVCCWAPGYAFEELTVERSKASERRGAY
jgi:hypothetical protein